MAGLYRSGPGVCDRCGAQEIGFRYHYDSGEWLCVWCRSPKLAKARFALWQLWFHLGLASIAVWALYRTFHG